MQTEITWYIPNRVILARFWGRIPAEESAQVTPSILKLMEESSAPKIHVLLDDGQMDGPPGNLKQMREFAAFLNHPKTGWVLGVAHVNIAVQFMGSFLIQFFKARYKRFNNIPEALAFLAHMEPDLKDLLPHDNNV